MVHGGAGNPNSGTCATGTVSLRSRPAVMGMILFYLIFVACEAMESYVLYWLTMSACASFFGFYVCFRHVLVALCRGCEIFAHRTYTPS